MKTRVKVKGGRVLQFGYGHGRVLVAEEERQPKLPGGKKGHAYSMMNDVEADLTYYQLRHLGDLESLSGVLDFVDQFWCKEPDNEESGLIGDDSRRYNTRVGSIRAYVGEDRKVHIDFTSRFDLDGGF